MTVDARFNPVSSGMLAIACLLPDTAVTAAVAEQETTIPKSCDTVVKLFGAGLGTLDSYGSGTLISEDGHVITVWNHLINTGYLTAVTSDGRRFQLDVIGTSAAHDLAVLRLVTTEDDRFPFVDRMAAISPPPGSPVLAFSNMFRVATGNEPVSVVHGIVAAESKLQAGLGRWKLPLTSQVLILDAITNNSGAAGGLLTDDSGQPIGILGRELLHDESGTWVNYAVPFATLNPVIDTILSGGSVESESTRQPVDPVSDTKLTSSWGFTLLPDVLNKTPAWIDRVIPDSTAARAGLKRGDLVVLLDESVVRTARELRTQFAEIRSGQPVTIIVNRDGGLETIRLRAP